MFTGIVKNIGTVEKIREEEGGLKIVIRVAPFPKLVLGDSVAVSGICSTVTQKGKGWFAVHYMPETLKKTTAPSWEEGDRVNLEYSLKLSSGIHGNLVQGHVDTRGKVTVVRSKGNSKEITIALPKAYMKYIVPKGAITVDGVALTIVDVSRSEFTVALIPHTLKITTLASLKKGSEVNVETDMFAKYVYRFLTTSH